MVTKPQIYNPCGGHLSLDFVNSTGREPDVVENERLVDYAALLQWCRESGSLPAARARALGRAGQDRPDAAEAVVVRAVALREALFEVWHAYVCEGRPPGSALALVNAELALALQHARLEQDSRGFAWTWEPAPEALDMPLWQITRAAADLLASPERELVAECDACDCLWLFLDRTRNHGRRWCEMKTCGNRDKVRQHRLRKRG